MFKRIIQIVGLIITIGFLIVTVSFSSKEVSPVKCENISVLFEKDQVISIDKSEIIKLVKKADKSILQKKLSQINSEIIEIEVEKHQTIEKAEVFKIVTIDSSNYVGQLAVKIKHRTPIIRVMAGTSSYFMDSEGFRIPVSSRYAANVLVVSGRVDENYIKKELMPFIKYLEKDEFWKAQIEQIYVASGHELILTPLVGDHVIEFGTVVDFKKKLVNIKGFYEQVLAQNNWGVYNKINVKFENQIIGTKN